MPLDRVPRQSFRVTADGRPGAPAWHPRRGTSSSHFEQQCLRVLKIALVSLVPLFLLASGRPLAQADVRGPEVKGSKDHPLVGRFAGSIIRFYEAKDFDELVLGLGGFAWQDREQRFVWSKSERYEGKITRITYVAPKGASTLAIIRSYEEALRTKGFELLFAGGDRENLGKYQGWYARTNRDPEGRRQYLIGDKATRYLATRLRRAEGDVYASVFAAEGNVSISGFPTIQVDVVEVKALEGGLVRAEAMAEQLAKTGRVAVYTIYFDPDKAEVKPESEPTLAEIARLLRQNPALRLWVVGHTDSVGALAHNMDLSQRRADAVVRALAARKGVEPARLQAAGVGPLAPVAPNGTDDGRARNRRVELVAQ